MPFPLAHILAQAITLSVGDRTDARYVNGDYTHYEAGTRPSVGLMFGWRRSALTLSYSPSFLLIPLETKPRHLAIFQAASIGAMYSWRTTNVAISEGAGYGQLSFQVGALADPGLGATVPQPSTPAQVPTGGPPTPVGGAGTPTGTTGTTTGTPGGTTTNPQATNQVRINDQIIRYASSTTSAGISHMMSKHVMVGGGVGYSMAGGVAESREELPWIRGAYAAAYITDARPIDARSTVSTSLVGQYATSSLDIQAWGAILTEGYAYKFNGHTSTRVSAGISVVRTSQGDGTVAWSIFPTFGTGISYTDKLGGGDLTLSASAGASPYLDPLRATIDPRLGVGVNAAWAKHRFSIGLGAGAAISLVDSGTPGAVNSVGATLGASYRLGAGFSVDAGGNTAWQTFQGSTIIPASYTVYVGLTWGAQKRLR